MLVLSCGPVLQHLLCEEQYVVDGWLSLLRRTYLCEEQYDVVDGWLSLLHRTYLSDDSRKLPGERKLLCVTEHVL